MKKKEMFTLLENGNDEIYNAIKSRYGFYALFDKDISDWLSTMYHFGGYGEFYEMVELMEQKLFN